MTDQAELARVTELADAIRAVHDALDRLGVLLDARTPATECFVDVAAAQLRLGDVVRWGDALLTVCSLRVDGRYVAAGLDGLDIGPVELRYLMVEAVPVLYPRRAWEPS